MRVFRIVLPGLAAVAILAPATGRADPYRWCAVSGDAGGASNCGFVTIEQCRATVSGIGSFCVPNQFYTGQEKRSTTGSGRYERRYRDNYER